MSIHGRGEKDLLFYCEDQLGIMFPIVVLLLELVEDFQEKSQYQKNDF